MPQCGPPGVPDVKLPPPSTRRRSERCSARRRDRHGPRDREHMATHQSRLAPDHLHPMAAPGSGLLRRTAASRSARLDRGQAPSPVNTSARLISAATTKRDSCGPDTRWGAAQSEQVRRCRRQWLSRPVTTKTPASHPGELQLSGDVELPGWSLLAHTEPVSSSIQGIGREQYASIERETQGFHR